MGGTDALHFLFNGCHYDVKFASCFRIYVPFISNTAFVCSGDNLFGFSRIDFRIWSLFINIDLEEFTLN
jgi:hypothetical protein